MEQVLEAIYSEALRAQRAWLQSNEVDKVSLGRGHVVGEEVNQCVEELCALGIRLIDTRKAWNVEGEKKHFPFI